MIGLKFIKRQKKVGYSRNTNKYEPDEAAKYILGMRDNPELFFTECLDVNPEFIWDKMLQIIESVRDNKCTAVKAAHSTSKTYTAARLALWFLYTHRPSTVITTAPTHNQVQEVLWREIRDAKSSARATWLPGDLTVAKLDIEPKWFALGFSTRPDTVTREATRFQGYHNEYVLIILDEAAGIMKEIWDAVEGLLADPNSKLLVIGNPTSASGEFPKCFRDPNYKKITISVLDTPNYKAGKIIIPGVSGREYYDRILKKYGAESNFFKGRVLGEIPEEDLDQIISIADYDRARKRRFSYKTQKRRFIAGDPASGGDESVFYYMEETDIKDALIFRHKNAMITAGRVKVFATAHDTNWYAGDSIGAGGAICDRLDEFGMKVIRVDAGERQKSGVPEIYFNRRAQMWIEGGNLFHEDEVELGWDDELLREQLTSIKQTVRSGRIFIQEKKEIRSEFGWSPDRADAYLHGLHALPKIKDQKQTVTRQDRYDRKVGSRKTAMAG